MSAAIKNWKPRRDHIIELPGGVDRTSTFSWLSGEMLLVGDFGSWVVRPREEQAHSDAAQKPDLLNSMSQSELRTMLVDVVRDEVSMRGRKNSKAQRASAVIEVSEMDQAAARAAARRIGFIVHPGRGKGRR